ncbi:MAG: twin-arginine translocase TatA/TatE family subunit [Solirubrobacteraceae bacterium]
MGLDNPIHIAFLLVIVLLVFGAKRLPEMGKSLGAGLRGFKESVSGEHEHESLMTATEHAPTGMDDPPPSAPVNDDLARERTPTHPVA